MSVNDPYRAIQEGAALGAVARRKQIAIAGQDRAAYLQGLLTNDIQALAAGSGCYAAWLTPQGRMITDVHVLASDSLILLDVPAELVEATLQRLDQFLFSEDVRFESLAETMAAVWVHGPMAASALEKVLGGAGFADWSEYRHAPQMFGEETVVVARIDQLGVPGFCVYVSSAQASALRAALLAVGVVDVGAEAIEAARIEAAYPVFGLDMDEATIPLEAGIESRAISFTKGCYVGQEIIIRVMHRGHGRVAKRLVQLVGDGPRVDRGAKIVTGDREVGAVTSSAISPRLGSIALGYVHRDFSAPGTELRVNAADMPITVHVSGAPDRRV